MTKRVPLLLLAATLTACGRPTTPVPVSEPAQVDEALQVTTALFRPTGHGATLQLVGERPLEARVRWGVAAGPLDHERELDLVDRLELELDGLPPDARVTYDVAVRAPGGAEWQDRGMHDFHTARARGSEFRVGFVADSHVHNLPLHPGSRQLLDLSIARCLEDDLDFVVLLGDEACVHFYGDPASSFEVADARWRQWRDVFAPLLAEVPCFLTLGNHEGEAGYYRELELPGGVRHLQRWATAARKRHFLDPLPTTYPEGGEDEGWRDPGDPTGANASPLQNYFAWTWGDALFVVLDVHRYTVGTPRAWDPKRPAEEVTLGVDDWTLGEAQLAWLERTLRESDAKYKLVVAHHVLGGWRWGFAGVDPDAPYKYGRGGARYALVGEQARVTELMREHGARFFLYGHDHVFAHQAAEGVEFVCCGRPSFLTPPRWLAPGWREAYGSSEERSASAFLATVGYTCVTVGPERLVIEFVRSAPAAARVVGENVSAGPDGVFYRWDTR